MGSSRVVGSTMGSSVSDISLPPGLTHTMERSASADLSHERSAGEPDEDLRERREEEDRQQHPLQVSVTLPSMNEESDDDDDNNDEEEFNF